MKTSFTFWSEKRKLVFITVFHILWGVVLWLSISKYGMGVSTDSVQYMFAGLNLTRGLGLVTYDGSPYLLWPPLYPWLLAGVHLVTQWDMLASAAFVQFVFYWLAAYSISILFLRMFPDHFPLACAGIVLANTGPEVLLSFQSVGSDYIHFALVLLFIVLAGEFNRNPTSRPLAGMVLTAALAGLMRYIGAALIPLGMLTIFWKTRGTLWERVRRSLWMLAAAAPTFLWLAFTWKDRLSYRPPISFRENWMWFSRTILEWWTRLPEANPSQLPFLLGFWLALAILTVFLARGWTRRKSTNEAALPVLGYGLLYTAALFAVAGVSYFNKLTGRFVLPVYVPVITLPLLVIYESLRAGRNFGGAKHRLVIAGSMFALILLMLPPAFNVSRIAADSIHNGARGGNSYNTRLWNENSVFQSWKENPPAGDVIIYSNFPAGAAFHTWQTTHPSPRKYAGPYSTEVLPLPADLFPAGKEVYLIWIEPNGYLHTYTRQELAEMLALLPLFESADGGIYRMEAD